MLAPGEDRARSLRAERGCGTIRRVTDDLDEVDRQLLAAVQQDARTPQTTLAGRVGLSAPAVNRRLRRLTDAGYIARSTAVLAPERLGHSLTVIAQVEIASEQPEQLDRLQASFVACPQVQQCYYVTGEWDFVLVLLVRDMDQYTRLIRELFFASSNVNRFKTLVVMNRAKATLDVPLEPTS
jgi:Lrp/AsnC family transcriptional regulator, leucine-responsive regulatory protein